MINGLNFVSLELYKIKTEKILWQKPKPRKEWDSNP